MLQQQQKKNTLEDIKIVILCRRLNFFLLPMFQVYTFFFYFSPLAI